MFVAPPRSATLFFAFKIESIVCVINLFLHIDLFALYKEKIHKEVSTQAEEWGTIKKFGMNDRNIG